MRRFVLYVCVWTAAMAVPALKADSGDIVLWASDAGGPARQLVTRRRCDGRRRAIDYQRRQWLVDA